jgi:MFS family permease
VSSTAATASSAAEKGASVVLLTLAAGQFLMTLDTSVMNVSIATVASDVGTTVTGIQGAITAYTLVMASLMIIGAKIGAIIGRKRAFAIGCVIYGCGSFTTSIAPNLPVLLFGWSFLEGVGAALILPAIVALVAGNFPVARRPAAYGMVAAAGAIAVAVGPLIGGIFTTYFSWRWVFAGEVLIVIAILILARRIADAPPEKKPQLDVVGGVLSAAGLGLLVFGVLRSSEWGWIKPKPGATSWWGLSPTIWLVLAGFGVLYAFLQWAALRERQGKEPLVRPALLQNKQLRGGLTMFFFQYLAQAGLFFVVPLYLSVALGLSALQTGVRLTPRASALHPDSGPEIVLLPMLLIGLGVGALASQLGSVTVSAVPDDQAPEVGGIQNTATNLGASMGTALAGALLIAATTGAFLKNIEQSDAIPSRVKEQANVKLAGGVPFVSDSDLNAALDEANVHSRAADDAVAAYQQARITGLKSGLAILALMTILALVFSRAIPTTQPKGEP